MLFNEADEFIDDDQFGDMPASARHGIEKSRHFFRPDESRGPYVQRDVMEDRDDFERTTTEECYQKLIRLRNDVYSLLKALSK